MDVKKIVYATNLSEPTFRVLDGLSGLKNLGLQEIVLLSNNASLDLFEVWKKRLSGLGIHVSIKIDPCNLSTSVLNIIHENSISLVVLHFNKKENRRIFGGSILNDIIKSTNIPLLIVDKDEKGLNFSSKGMFERVLLVSDWPDASENALQYVIGLKELISELDIVTVIYEKLTVRDLRQLKEKMIETRKRCTDIGIEAEYHLYAGDIADEILLAAQDYDSTVIIMDATRVQKLKDIFRGKPSSRVAERSSIPALIIS
ncbi:MAG: universal stress protein [Candidatus Desulfaltia sp.]|nr:universal stress protein [Candidatus Desulfaltia sp.]